MITAINSVRTRFQEEMKNSEENPSGPGTLSLGRASKASLISSKVGIETSLVAKCVAMVGVDKLYLGNR